MTTTDWIERHRHPYDNGYWARYDGKPRPSGKEQRQGWHDCDRELKLEAEPTPPQS